MYTMSCRITRWPYDMTTLLFEWYLLLGEETKPFMSYLGPLSSIYMHFVLHTYIQYICISYYTVRITYIQYDRIGWDKMGKLIYPAWGGL